MSEAIYDRLQQAGERAETIAALMRAALRTWDRADTPLARLLALVEQAREDAGSIISLLPLRGHVYAELDDDEGCPKDDPDCYGPDDGCHDACERPDDGPATKPASDYERDIAGLEHALANAQCEAQMADAYAKELSQQLEAERREVKRLSGWLERIEGGDHPCTDEQQLRRWAYEAVTLGRLPESLEGGA